MYIYTSIYIYIYIYIHTCSVRADNSVYASHAASAQDDGRERKISFRRVASEWATSTETQHTPDPLKSHIKYRFGLIVQMYGCAGCSAALDEGLSVYHMYIYVDVYIIHDILYYEFYIVLVLLGPEIYHGYPLIWETAKRFATREARRECSADPSCPCLGDPSVTP